MTSSAPGSNFPIEIDVTSVEQMRASNQEFLLLDVRQPEEYETARIDGSTLIPMGELGERIAELEADRNRRIIVYCHHGGRSLQVTHALRQHGFPHVQNMSGGIDQWSVEVDDTIPRY